MTLAKPYREIIDFVDKRVIGQPRAIKQLERALKIMQAGLRETNKPGAVLMFAGPTGTGKSETAEALAEAIHGTPEAVCRVDCNDLTEAHTAASLTGSPPGYVGSAEGNTLLDKKLIEGSPGKPGILVLEEVEKAHPKIFDTLLGVFDKAVLHMINGKGKIDFSNTIIIMTSNAGARDLAVAASGTRLGFAPVEAGPRELSGDDRKAIVRRKLDELFRPEFLNRLDDVVVFRWLDKIELDEIVDIFLGQLDGRLAKQSHRLTATQLAKDFLVANGTDVRNGARPLKRTIRRYLEDPLSELIVDGLEFQQVNFHVDHVAGADQLTIRQEEIPYVEPPSTAVVVPAASYPLVLAAAANAQEEGNDEPYPEDYQG